jgi:staphylococcal nuclease domain-containing protein 1
MIGRFINLVNNGSEYYEEAINRFKASCDGRKLIANVDYKEGNGLLHLRLIDPADPATGNAPGEASINIDLLREGYATIDRKGVSAKYAGSYPAIMKQLESAVKEAKASRAGIFEYGDIEPDY